MGTKLWYAIIREEDIPQTAEFSVGQSHFWVDVWSAWARLTFDGPLSENQVLEQFLWLNSNILINKRPVKWNRWMNAGILFIKDLLGEDNSFLEHKALSIKFNLKIPFTQYWGLRKAIPYKWLEWLSKGTHIPIVNWIDLSATLPSISRLAYHELNKIHFMFKEVLLKWQNASSVSEIICFKEEELIRAIKSIYCMTNYIKLRSFQYRLLCKGIITNVHLVYYGIKPNSLCTFCGVKKEMLKYLFMSCQLVKKLWMDIFEWVDINPENISFKDLIVNDLGIPPKDVKNLIVLATKMYICSMRCQEKMISTIALKAWVKTIYDMEGEIARKNDKLAQHKLKWVDFY